MAKPINKSAKIREYMTKHPLAKAKEIAEALKLTPQYIHTVMYKTRNPTPKKPKRVIITATEAMLANKLGVSTKDYAQQVYQLTKGRGRRHPVTGKHLMQGTDIIAKHHTDMINHPPHYKAGGMETIDFIEAKDLGYHLGNVIKYITRADHKGNKLEDLKKAQWYLNRAIEQTQT
jgi:hypothetical protein